MDITCDFNNLPKNGHYKPLPEKEELKTQLLLNIRSCLSYLFPHGTFHGNEYRIGNLQGSKGKSLRVELTGNKVGLWNDFATGEGGDIIDLWAAAHRKDVKAEFHEVMASIGEWLGYYRQHKVDEAKPTSSWDYLDESGDAIVKVYRYDAPLGKRYLPFDVKKSSYTAPEVRPLYNIPGIIKSDKVVIVEGEKCAESLIKQGITATTAMSGANAPIDKTDWSPLKGKHIIIWPDNDEPGKQYAEKVAKKLIDLGVISLVIVKISQDKPKAWDAADCIQEGACAEKFLTLTPCTNLPIIDTPNTKNLISFPARRYLNDKSPIPEDIISPRILIQKGLLVLGGPPKIGKSDFLISWLMHMAAGVSFLGMTPSRPLKIFYLQTEIEYPYMKERLQQLKLDKELLDIAANNLIITPRVQLSFSDEEVHEIENTVEQFFKPDIIAIDPLRNVFSEYGNENDNSNMLFFLQKTITRLQNIINSEAGIIITHYTKKLSKKMLEEDPFQSLSGAGSLRGFYSTGMIMFSQDEESTVRQIVFELRNGERVPSKLVDKTSGSWQLIEQWDR